MTTPSQVPCSSAHFVDRRIVQQTSHETHGVNRTKNCFVCSRTRFWFTNHPVNEKLKSYRKNKQIGQFMASFNTTDNESENDTEQISDAVGDIVSHFI